MARRPDRRASRSAEADALPASAGAVGLRPHPRRHEPPARPRLLSAPRRAAARRRGRTSRSPAISSSAFPARRDADFEDTLRLVEAVGYAQRLFVQIQPAARHARGRDADQVPEPVKAERLHAPAGAAAAPAGAPSTPRCSAATIDVLLERPGKRPGQLVGRSPWLQAVQVDAPAVADRRRSSRVDHRPDRIEHACSAHCRPTQPSASRRSHDRGG